jgi:hypothetical protein
LAGTPTTTGSYTFVVSATDSSGGGGPYVGTHSYTVFVDPAAALARAFVSAAGSDGNPCSLVAPCRTLAHVLTQTRTDGEVIVMDSAGYGPAVITRPVAVISPAGVMGGIAVPSGTGIVINTGSGRVTLRGLTINGMGGTIGIDVQSAAVVYLDRMVIKGFSGTGLQVAPASGGALLMTGSRIRDSGIGARFAPGSGLLTVDVDNTQFEANGTGAVFAGADTAGVLGSSQLTGGTIGILLQPTVAGAAANVEVRKSTLSGNTNAGAQAGGGAGPATVTLVGAQVTDNGTGLLVQSGGAVAVTDSTVTRNVTGISLSGGGAAVSLGDNRVMNNVTNGAFSSVVAKQ